MSYVRSINRRNVTAELFLRQCKLYIVEYSIPNNVITRATLANPSFHALTDLSTPLAPSLSTLISLHSLIPPSTHPFLITLFSVTHHSPNHSPTQPSIHPPVSSTHPSLITLFTNTRHSPIHPSTHPSIHPPVSPTHPLLITLLSVTRHSPVALRQSGAFHALLQESSGTLDKQSS